MKKNSVAIFLDNVVQMALSHHQYSPISKLQVQFLASKPQRSAEQQTPNPNSCPVNHKSQPSNKPENPKSWPPNHKDQPQSQDPNPDPTISAFKPQRLARLQNLHSKHWRKNTKTS